MTATSDYIGNELELFAHARRWKAYFAQRLSSYIKGDVLEVGAGLGGTTELLCTGRETSWTCLEPDARLHAEIVAKRDAGRLPQTVRPVLGTLETAVPHSSDTVLYVDVLEHIEDDTLEIERALRCLRPGGHLIVLAPAHQELFTPFDAAIGHFRRYDRASLCGLPAPGARLEKCYYLDSVGLLASLANKLVLRQSQPRISQILLWDRVMVPVSMILDPVLGYAFGKTVIGIWRKDGDPQRH